MMATEMCPCGEMTDSECREANRKAFEASRSVCCARFSDSADTPTPPRGTGEESPASPLADEVTRLRHELTTLRARLAAVEGERERVMADYASELAMIFADRKANRMELLAKAAAVEEQVRLHEATIERQAEAIGILQRAESEAERRGAERALQEAHDNFWPHPKEGKDPHAWNVLRGEWIAERLSALFPPPGAEVGRG